MHKYNIMCFFSKEYVKSHVSTIAVKSFAVSVAIFQWFTCFLFLLTRNSVYVLLCFLISVAAAVFLPLFWNKYDRMRNERIKIKCDQLVDEHYNHPLENKCNGFLRGQESS